MAFLCAWRVKQRQAVFHATCPAAALEKIFTVSLLTPSGAVKERQRPCHITQCWADKNTYSWQGIVALWAPMAMNLAFSPASIVPSFQLFCAPDSKKKADFIHAIFKIVLRFWPLRQFFFLWFLSFSTFRHHRKGSDQMSLSHFNKTHSDLHSSWRSSSSQRLCSVFLLLPRPLPSDRR